MVGIVDQDGAVAHEQEVAAVRSEQDIGIEDQACVALGDDRPVDRDDGPEVLGRRGQIVGRGDDRLAGPRLRVERRP